MFTHTRKPRNSRVPPAAVQPASRHSSKGVERDLIPAPAHPQNNAADSGTAGHTETAANTASRPLDFTHIPNTAGRLQRKAMVSVPDDPLEREADAMAERVMQTARPVQAGPAPTAASSGSALTQRAASDHGAAAVDGHSAVQAAASGGMPLAAELRAYFEPRFGQDFSHVRVHADAAAATAARSVQAQAYTVGSDVVFGSGQYAPATAQGRRLIAHELTHVVQQGAGAAARGAPTVQRYKDPAAVDACPATAGGIPVQAGQPTLSAFITGSAKLTAAHLVQLNQVKTELQGKPLTAADTLLLVGHTDAVGTEERNQQLGQQRADSVQAWIQKNIGTAAQIKTASMGESSPAVATKDPEHTEVAANRRVEIYVQRCTPTAAPAQAPAPVVKPATPPGPRVGPLADPPGPAIGPDAPSTDPKARINLLTELILTTADKTRKDQLVRELRDWLVKIQPVMPKDAAKKAIDDAITSLVDKGIKAGIMALLQAATGKSPSTMPPDSDNNHTGPAIAPKDLGEHVIKLPPLPLDNVPKSHRYSFEFHGLKSPYKPGAYFDFTLYTPDGFEPNGQAGAGRVVVMEFEDFTKNGGKDANRIRSVRIESKGKVSMSVLAPEAPGRYVLGVIVGFEFQSTTAEFTVEAKP